MIGVWGGGALGSRTNGAFVNIKAVHQESKSALFGIWCYKASRHHLMCCKGPTTLDYDDIIQPCTSL